MQKLPDTVCPLHTQYLSYFPLAYISYATGRSYHVAYRPPTRVLVISCVHAHVVAPALCVVAVAALRDLTDLSIVKGSLYASVGAPCIWLSLSLSPNQSGTTAQLVACNYIASLLAVPLSTYVLHGKVTVLCLMVRTVQAKNNGDHRVIHYPSPVAAVMPACEKLDMHKLIPKRDPQCELATLPSYQSIAEICGAVLVPYYVGATLPDCGGEGKRHNTLIRLCALALLYVDCCGKLKNAEGLMYLGDVLVTLTLEATCSVTSVATCWLYARCGLVSEGDAIAVALASIPKCGFGTVSSSAVCSWGVHSLPAAMAAPLRAVLLADMAARSQRDVT